MPESSDQSATGAAPDAPAVPPAPDPAPPAAVPPHAAGVDGMTILGFRKSFGTYAKAMGLGPLEVQAILGHTNVATQEHYDEEAVESLRPAMGRIAAFFGQVGT